MPAVEAVEINWPAVRTLAIAVGVREAARRLGISEEATMKRCQREGWLATPEARMAASNGVAFRSPNALSAAVRTPAQAMLQEITELGKNSRISIARGLHKGAQAVEQMAGDEILTEAQNIKSTVQSLAVVHGWQSSAPLAKINLSIVTGTQPPTLDAEFTEMPASQDIMDY